MIFLSCIDIYLATYRDLWLLKLIFLLDKLGQWAHQQQQGGEEEIEINFQIGIFTTVQISSSPPIIIIIIIEL